MNNCGSLHRRLNGYQRLIVYLLVFLLAFQIADPPKAKAVSLVEFTVGIIIVSAAGIVYYKSRIWLKHHLPTQTVTTAPFSVPTAGNAVSVFVYSTTPFVSGEYVIVTGPAHFTVGAINSATNLVLIYAGKTNDVPAGTIINSGAVVAATVSVVRMNPGSSITYVYDTPPWPGNFGSVPFSQWLYSDSFSLFDGSYQGMTTGGAWTGPPINTTSAVNTNNLVSQFVASMTPSSPVQVKSMVAQQSLSTSGFSYQCGIGLNGQPFIASTNRPVANSWFSYQTETNWITVTFGSDTMIWTAGDGVSDDDILYGYDDDGTMTQASVTNSDGDVMLLTSATVTVQPGSETPIVIQRSQDLKNWTTVATPAVLGAQTMTVTDSNAPTDHAFYRAVSP